MRLKLYLLLLCKMRNTGSMIIGGIQFHAHLGLSYKCRAIKRLFVCNDWDVEPLDLLNGLALGYYHRPLRY